MPKSLRDTLRDQAGAAVKRGISGAPERFPVKGGVSQLPIVTVVAWERPVDWLSLFTLSSIRITYCARFLLECV
jgi:hypothetical protein